MDIGLKLVPHLDLKVILLSTIKSTLKPRYGCLLMKKCHMKILVMACKVHLSRQGLLKRRRSSDVMLKMMSAMAADIGRIADALTENNKTVCLDELFEMVQTIPGFDDDLIIEACEYLSFDERRAMMFMKLNERLRKKWLLKRLRGQGN